jgi:hypothetical protein
VPTSSAETLERNASVEGPNGDPRTGTYKLAGIGGSVLGVLCEVKRGRTLLLFFEEGVGFGEGHGAFEERGVGAGLFQLLRDAAGEAEGGAEDARAYADAGDA